MLSFKNRMKAKIGSGMKRVGETSRGQILPVLVGPNKVWILFLFIRISDVRFISGEVT